VEERHEIGVVKPGTTRRAALKTVFMYIHVYRERMVLKYMLQDRWVGGCELYAHGSRHGKVEDYSEHVRP
jgi:hypothetical protein